MGVDWRSVVQLKGLMESRDGMYGREEILNKKNESQERVDDGYFHGQRTFHLTECFSVISFS